MERFIIYLATNIINKKRYIGYSEQALEERRKEHLNESTYDKPRLIFQRAIKKHGLQNFHWCIIDKTAKNLNELKLLEKKYIAEFNTFGPNGYNRTPGGDGPIPKGCTKDTNEVLAKVTESRKKTYADPNKNQNILLGFKKMGKTMSIRMTGKTKETCERIKKAAKSHSKTMTGKTKANTEWRIRQGESFKKTYNDPEKNQNFISGYKIMDEKRRDPNRNQNFILGYKKMGEGNRGQNNPMSKTNIEKRKFKKDYPELFTFNKEIPPILVDIQNPPTVDNIIQGRLNYGTDTSQRLEHQPERN